MAEWHSFVGGWLFRQSKWRVVWIHSLSRTKGTTLKGRNVHHLKKRPVTIGTSIRVLFLFDPSIGPSIGSEHRTPNTRTERRTVLRAEAGLWVSVLGAKATVLRSTL